MTILEEVAPLLQAIDALGLPRGAWIATDADGTLWATDVADLAWHRLLSSRTARSQAAPVMRRMLEAAGQVAQGDVHADAGAVYQLYLKNLLDDRAMVLAMTACWAGWRPGEVAAFGQRLGREAVAPRVYATTSMLLHGLHERGLKVVVVSGSPRLLVEAAIRELGLPFDALVVGAETNTADELLGDCLLDPVPWQEGKVEALKHRIGAAPPVAMGDTLGDLELLEAATRLRVLVHPRPALRAKALGWSDRSWLHFAPPRTVDGTTVRPPTLDRAIAGP